VHLSTGNRLPSPVTVEEAKTRSDWPCGVRPKFGRCVRRVCTRTTHSVVREGRILIPTKWVYDYKTDHQNRIIDHKARLLAKGFRQTPGKTLAKPTLLPYKNSTFRLLLQYAAEYKLGINQIDVKTAFLNGELIQEVIISGPQACR
jgi:hypothetical protein